MSPTYALFLQWKSTKGLTSDYAGSVRLGIGRATVSQWKHGTNADPETIARMCDDIGEPLTKWLPQVQAAKAHTQAEKKVWMRLAGAAAVAIATTLITPARANHLTQSIDCASDNSGSMYLM